jgi:transposase
MEKYVTPGYAKESIRDIYQIRDPQLAAEFTQQLSEDLQDRSLSPEVNRLGRTIARWATQITNWHNSGVTNGPTEGLNNLIKRIKRTAFGFRKLRQLPNPSTPIRWQAQLATPRNNHSPLISEAPLWFR